MVAVSKTIESIPDGSGYNKIFRHRWRTSTNALPMMAISRINRITEGRKWGWTFMPHENMNYSRENWYEDQMLILTFDNEMDLIQSKLEVADLL